MDVEEKGRVSGTKMSKGDATRQAIKDAARRVLGDNQFGNVKISTIMAEAGRTPGAFYRHFRSKEELLRELVEDFRHELREKVNRPFKPGEDVLHNLLIGIGAFWTVYRENWAVATAAFQLSIGNAEFSDIWRTIRRLGVRALVRVIHQAQQEGYCPNLDADLAGSALCSMLEYTCYNWSAAEGDFAGERIDDATAISVLTRIVIEAILWRKPTVPDAREAA